jgi:hypothetical protein
MLKTVSSIVNAIGALNYKGTWNASTNSPALASGVGTKGDYYVVSTAGTTSLDGISNWGVGDWAAFNGSVWQRVEGGADLNGVNLSATGAVVFSSLTGYLKGNGASQLTASATVPNTDVSGLGTMSTQNANAVAITGGTITGVTSLYNSRGQTFASGGSTTTMFTLPNISSNQVYQLSVRQAGGVANTVVAQVLAFGANAGALRIAQDNTNPVLDMNITTSGLDVQLAIGAGFGGTTWDWVLTRTA